MSKCIQSQTPHKYVTIKQTSIEQYEWLDEDYLKQHVENMGTHKEEFGGLRKGNVMEHVRWITTPNLGIHISTFTQ